MRLAVTAESYSMANVAGWVLRNLESVPMDVMLESITFHYPESNNIAERVTQTLKEQRADTSRNCN